MTRRGRAKLRACAMVLAAASSLSQAQTVDVHATPIEATLLPQFCWKQFIGNKFSGPAFHIPHKTCGYETNHYCGGLVYLDRARKTIGDEAKRQAYLRKAKTQTLYTLRGIKKYPHCPIRNHVEATLRVINAELKASR